jgi:hypothetical protein
MTRRRMDVDNPLVAGSCPTERAQKVPSLQVKYSASNDLRPTCRGILPQPIQDLSNPNIPGGSDQGRVACESLPLETFSTTPG